MSSTVVQGARRRRRHMAAAGLTVVVLLAGACSESRHDGLQSASRSPAEDAAVTSVNAARAAALADVQRVEGGAQAVGDADAVAVQGRRASIDPAERRVETTLPVASASVSRLAHEVSTYAEDVAALSALGAVDVAGVVTAESSEVSRLRALSAVLALDWPAVRALAHAVHTWQRRCAAGWYSSDNEAADAYAVLLDSVPRHDEVQVALARAFGAVSVAGQAVAAAGRAAS